MKRPSEFSPNRVKNIDIYIWLRNLIEIEWLKRSTTLSVFLLPYRTFFEINSSEHGASISCDHLLIALTFATRRLNDMQDIEISYEKRLSPPEGEPWLETRGGLKYWLVKREPTIGLKISVLTEDPGISMHSYGGGGREDYGSFLFCYKGFQIGFIDHELGEACWPLPPKRLPEDVEEGRRTGTVILRITAIGTPVFDCSAHYARDRDEKLIKDVRGRYVRKGPYYRAATDYSRAPTDLTGFNWQDFLAEWRYRLRRSTGFGKKSSAYVTSLSWKDYCAGKRDRFRSRRQQEEMLSIWPDLFTGMRGQLAILRPGARKTLPNGRPVPKRVMRFSDDVIRQFEAGELIDGMREKQHK